MTAEGKVGTVVPLHEELKIVFNKLYVCIDILFDHGCDNIGTDGGY